MVDGSYDAAEQGGHIPRVLPPSQAEQVSHITPAAGGGSHLTAIGREADMTSTYITAGAPREVLSGTSTPPQVALGEMALKPEGDDSSTAPPTRSPGERLSEDSHHYDAAPDSAGPPVAETVSHTSDADAALVAFFAEGKEDESLSETDKVIVHAATGVLLGEPPVQSPSEYELRRSLHDNPTIANTVLTADRLYPKQEEKPASRFKALDNLKQTVATMRSPEVDEGQVALARTADRVVYTRYGTHAHGPLGRLLLSALTAELGGKAMERQPSSDALVEPAEGLAEAVANRFQEAFQEASKNVTELPQDVYKPINDLRYQLAQARRADPSLFGGYAKRALGEFAAALDKIREKKRAEEAAKGAWEEGQARLPGFETAQSAYHNKLLVLPPVQLGTQVATAYEAYREAGAKAAASIKEAELQYQRGQITSERLGALRTELSTKVDEQARQVAGAGMALLELSQGARLDDEEAIRLALSEQQRAPQLRWELRKIEAAKLYDRLRSRILPAAISSAKARQGAIQEGYITPADAILCTYVDPDTSFTPAQGARESTVRALHQLRSDLIDLRGTPSQRHPSRGAFVSGVFSHYRHRP